MRGRQERSEADALRDEVVSLRVMARRLWIALKARTGMEATAFFTCGDEMRAADPVFDATQTVWYQHRISIVPCRTLADPIPGSAFMSAGPGPIEMYLGLWPDGTKRNLTRDQVLMMGGYDAREPSAAAQSHAVPF